MIFKTQALLCVYVCVTYRCVGVVYFTNMLAQVFVSNMHATNVHTCSLVRDVNIELLESESVVM